MNAIPMIYAKNIQFQVAIEFVILGFDEGELKLLAKDRNTEHDVGKWSLISGELEEDENLNQAAARILKQLTGLSSIHLEQLYT
jgi:8-oxo-dGTP diphosphatase